MQIRPASTFGALGLILAAVAIPAACGTSTLPGGLERNTTGADSGGGDDTTLVLVDAAAWHDAGDAGDGSDVSDASDASDASRDAGNGCTDGMMDNTETDIDCGGTVCAPCIDGAKCVEPSDCAGMGCVGNKCVTPTCSDKILNEGETDVDCGGPKCPKCTFGKKCGGNGDCSSNTCNGSACGCPSPMVVVPEAEVVGGAYCVDPTEVSAGDYDLFVRSNQPLPTTGVCAGVTSFIPHGNYPFPDATRPVSYVDWCDANAYCSWKGKQLCGAVGGGPIATACLNVSKSSDNGTVTLSDGGTADCSTVVGDGGASVRDAWYNACSAQGNNLYPYGGTYSKKCTDSVGPDGGVSGATSVVDGNDNLLPNGCVGGFTGLYNMSGNLAEWENSCDPASSGGPAADRCVVRGGSFRTSDPNELQCKWDNTETVARIPTTPDATAAVGIRCCLY